MNKEARSLGVRYYTRLSEITMTSLEKRHEARYQRRKAQRHKHTERYDNYERAISYNALYKANLIARKNVCWKASVQKYQKNLLRNICKTHRVLEERRFQSRGFVEFNISERGKTRHIRSIHYSERVVQRSLCDNILVPMLSNSLIYDNGACLQGKGVQWALDRMKAHLSKFYRENNFSNEGYILCFDFSSFFDSIDHKVCFKTYQEKFKDKDILKILHDLVYPFGFPISNAKWERVQRKMDKREYTGKSLGLGSQISQITAVAYPDRLDHFIKEVLRVRHYERYMDDGVLLFRTKQEAQDAAIEIGRFCERELKLHLSQKKTFIQKLSQPFKFLKVSFQLQASGKITQSVHRESITRERRKLKKLARFKRVMAAVQQSYGSWKGYALQRGGEKAVERMDELYIQLFRCDPPQIKLRER